MFGLGGRINSLDENSTEAEHCSIHYDDARDQALEDHDWKFASVEVSLALTGTAPDRWSYAYALPSNCIKPREIIASGVDPIEYDVGLSSDLTTKLIYTNQEDAILRYTARVKDPNLYTPGFVNAMACRIAMAIALPLTQDRGKLQDAVQMYAGMLSSAQVSDANTGHKLHEREASWIQGR